MRLKGTLGTIQHLETQLAEKDERINELENELSAAKKKPERDVQLESVYKERQGSVVKEKRAKELEKRVTELEEKLGEVRRKNSRLEMLNETLARKNKEEEGQRQDVELLAAKVARLKAKKRKLKAANER